MYCMCCRCVDRRGVCWLGYYRMWGFLLDCFYRRMFYSFDIGLMKEGLLICIGLLLWREN